MTSLCTKISNKQILQIQEQKQNIEYISLEQNNSINNPQHSSEQRNEMML